MTPQSRPGETPANVASAATVTADLSPQDPTLLGVFGPEAGMAALVRLPGGRIRKVAAGETLGSGTVVAIDARGLMLRRNGRTERLEIPGG